MLVAGVEVEYCEAVLDRTAPHDNVFSAVGVHPHEAEKAGDLERYRPLFERPGVCAIGEVGLDYYYNFSGVEAQLAVFRGFLQMARELELPAIIHCRDAFEDCYRLVHEVLGGEHPFVLHCFTGSWFWGKRFVNLGGYLGYNGMITFNKAEEIRESLRNTPLDRVVFETDSPYLAPVPFRGRTNEPAYTAYVVERAARELGMDKDELARQSTENAFKLFKLPADN